MNDDTKQDQKTSQWLTKIARPALKRTMTSVAKRILRKNYTAKTESVIKDIVDRVTSAKALDQITKVTRAAAQYQQKGEGAFLDLFTQDRDVPRWVFSVYYTLVMIMSRTPKHREDLFRKLISNCVPKTPEGRQQLQAAQDILRAQCGDFQCGAEVYWRVLQTMPDVCFLGMVVEAAKREEQMQLGELKRTIEQVNAMETVA